MHVLLKCFRALYSVYALIVWLAIMFLILPPIVLVSFLGKVKGGNIVFYFLRFWAHVWFPAVGIFVRKTWKAPKSNDPCIYLANHSSYLDAALAVKVMPLPFRPLGKSELSRIPLFGLIYSRSVVPVDRSTAKGRAQSMRDMLYMIKRNVSLLIFPEGTTNETEQPLLPFHSGAFRIAIETQTPIRPVLYVDNHARLAKIKFLSLNPGPCRVVFLPLVPVEGLTMEDVPHLKKQVRHMMEEELRKYRNYQALQAI
ncbi:1-acyl-sn-glycerol-3-phosphate acyltransferase [Chitinophaga lutea]|uniref:1-acyl-sn-glycerol-3-phosphate acyltransferase n=1 Tax=Chitinophaga lutea TaxID=2488634 RepID=A0A3N4Q4H0_9BACT|nr:lysophospholipid acyltransferase family protein [Chitinophaga lutea]RPE12371.1 1-acyl-sn-glycerol-3-phosphate acyltransferase [Chitinophaga lutea]